MCVPPNLLADFRFHNGFYGQNAFSTSSSVSLSTSWPALALVAAMQGQPHFMQSVVLLSQVPPPWRVPAT